MTHFDRFGPYRVHEQLGAGGTATVHRATIEVARGVFRDVALKRMLPEFAGNRRFIEHLIHEAKLASSLRHPNIAQIFELGCIERTYFIAMELVYGIPLLALMRTSYMSKTPAPIPIVLAILDELCDALDYASNGTDAYGEPLRILHRDLSPSNLLIADDGHLKLIDFGIAKAVAGTRFRTHSGLVKGKLGYMSVEAIDGEELDTRADIFSAGVIAWELIAARRLFKGKTDEDIIAKVRTAPITPPSKWNSACPAELDEIVLNALERRVDQRWASAAAMREALGVVRARNPGGRAKPRDVAAWASETPGSARVSSVSVAEDSAPAMAPMVDEEVSDVSFTPSPVTPSGERAFARAERVTPSPAELDVGDVSNAFRMIIAPWHALPDDTAQQIFIGPPTLSDEMPLLTLDDASKEVPVARRGDSLDDPSKEIRIESERQDSARESTVDPGDDPTKKRRAAPPSDD
ncbi:MAG TPA: serine/threonine-protein kinase [Kofleriaceae bacterium]|nr:serine/threonine-protein kinase [Kofleriaceae bacterium]